MWQGAVIVLNTSWLNKVGTPGLSLLSALKATARRRPLSAERLRVNAVSPGAIDTPIRRRGDPTEEKVRASNDRRAARIPLNCIGESEDSPTRHSIRRATCLATSLAPRSLSTADPDHGANRCKNKQAG
jgi:NAD(P)-dependent dehydrogenase (short-subunit alcohol dehydrogenase family)